MGTNKPLFVARVLTGLSVKHADMPTLAALENKPGTFPVDVYLCAVVLLLGAEVSEAGGKRYG